MANQGTDESPEDTISIVDVASGVVSAPIVTDQGAHGVVVSDDGTRAFVTNIVANTVSVVDVATRKVIQNIKVGEGPNGITFRRGRR